VDRGAVLAPIEAGILHIVNNRQNTVDSQKPGALLSPAPGEARPTSGCHVLHGRLGPVTCLRVSSTDHFEESSMRFPRIACLLAGAATLFSGAALAQKTTLLVYTALETDQIKAYQDGFNKAYPDIDLKWVRDSTGVITAKLLAEKSNPQADVVMGVAASSLALLDTQKMLIPYAPLNLDGIMDKYRDKKNPPAWFGMDVWGATVCFNTVEAQKKNLPKPETWKDLTKPIYKGQIVMPNPASSGTGFFDVSAWLTLWGDDNGKGGGWKYMDALHENIAQYTHSGSKPCNMAGTGEYVMGISFEYRANTNKAKGAPIDLVFPKEGLGWDLEAFAIHAGTKKLDAAKKLADWASSKDAMKLYGKNFAITAVPGVAEPLKNVPADYEARLVKMDFATTAANRERVLAEWNKRYDSKSEPKK
jgi:iron(III) transport system substrate-binding protein